MAEINSMEALEAAAAASGTETPDSSSQQSEASSQVAASPSETPVVAEAPANPVGEVVAPAYAPNYKFKFADPNSNGQIEKEFDEFLRPIIKDAETEKQIRSLYEKANGLDMVKPKYQETREKYATLQKEHESITTGIQELSGMIKKGDLDSFLEAVGISQEKIFQYTLNKLNYEQLPPEEKQVRDQVRAESQRASQLERQYQQLEQQYEQQSVQARTFQLDSTLTRADVSAQAAAFDSRAGRPGAFRDAVIERGQLAYFTQKKDISPDQAVQEVIALYGLSHAQPMAQAAPVQQAQSTQVAPPPVIPNVGGGRNVSPVSRKITSLEDLEAEYTEKYGS